VRRLSLVLVLLGGVTGSAAGQASIFDVRALGIPQAPLSAHATGMAGSIGLLDGMSGTNPAAITSIIGLTAGFNIFQDWRSSTSPGGTGSGSDAGMPFMTVINRVKESPVYFSGSFGFYTDRDFGIVTRDTTQLNGQPVAYKDSTESRGGTSDFRLAVGYKKGNKLALGFGFHFLTGSNRFTVNRTFGDSSFTPVIQRSELAYNAIGLSLGAVFHPAAPILLTAVIRHDGSMNVDRDSLQAYTFTLPWTLAGGVQYRAGAKATVNAQLSYSNWGVANDELIAQGGVGSMNTIAASVGAEIVTSPKQVGKFPLRLGISTRQLPFPLAVGQQPTELAIATGTGTRFAKGHAAIDAALQRVWRKADGGFSEDAWILTFGMVLKP
jgi:hypothetical protein